MAESSFIQGLLGGLEFGQRAREGRIRQRINEYMLENYPRMLEQQYQIGEAQLGAMRTQGETAKIMQEYLPSRLKSEKIINEAAASTAKETAQTSLDMLKDQAAMIRADREKYAQRIQNMLDQDELNLNMAKLQMNYLPRYLEDNQKKMGLMLADLELQVNANRYVLNNMMQMDEVNKAVTLSDANTKIAINNAARVNAVLESVTQAIPAINSAGAAAQFLNSLQRTYGISDDAIQRIIPPPNLEWDQQGELGRAELQNWKTNILGASLDLTWQVYQSLQEKGAPPTMLDAMFGKPGRSTGEGDLIGASSALANWSKAENLAREMYRLDHPEASIDELTGKFLGNSEEDYQKNRQQYMDKAIDVMRKDVQRFRYGGAGVSQEIGTGEMIPGWESHDKQKLLGYRETIPDQGARNLAQRILLAIQARDVNSTVDDLMKILDYDGQEDMPYIAAAESFLNEREKSNDKADQEFYKNVEKEISRRAQRANRLPVPEATGYSDSDLLPSRPYRTERPEWQALPLSKPDYRYQESSFRAPATTRPSMRAIGKKDLTVHEINEYLRKLDEFMSQFDRRNAWETKRD